MNRKLLAQLRARNLFVQSVCRAEGRLRISGWFNDYLDRIIFTALCGTK